MARKIPMRRCVATGQQFPKKELLRIVRTPENEIKVDLTGKMNGHGAYLKKDKEAFEMARKNKSLERALEVKIPEEFYEELKNNLLSKCKKEDEQVDTETTKIVGYNGKSINEKKQT